MTGYKIIKRGRKGWITPLPNFTLSKILEHQLSYKKQGAEFMPRPEWGIVKLYSVKTGSFPWGLLDKVLYVLKGHDIKIIRQKTETPDIEFNPKLRPYQKEAIESLIKNNGGVLSMATGAGKTFTCLEFLKQYKFPSLVLCPTKDLVTQWKKQSPEYVDVRTYQSVTKNLDLLNNYKIIVIDEVHIGSIGSIYKICMKLKEQILVGLSATCYRVDGQTMKMVGAVGNIVYSKDLRSLIDEGYLCDAVIDTVELERFNGVGNYHEIYDAYIVNNSERNDFIIDKCLNEYSDKKIILLVDRIEHGEMLLERLHNATFWNSKTKHREDSVRIIIGTSLLDQGIDLPDREIIILGGGGKSSIKVLQRIGRVLRKHSDKKTAVIVEFIDRAKYLYQHHKQRMEIYEQYGFINR